MFRVSPISWLVLCFGCCKEKSARKRAGVWSLMSCLRRRNRKATATTNNDARSFSNHLCVRFFSLNSFVLVAILCLASILSPACQCEAPLCTKDDSAHQGTDDPNGKVCTFDCECNNDAYTGTCSNQRCQSTKKTSCTEGASESCTHSETGCAGQRFCRKGQDGTLGWGDCTCAGEKSVEPLPEPSTEPQLDRASEPQTDAGEPLTEHTPESTCKEGETRSCYSGQKGCALGKDGKYTCIGLCRAGTSTCTAGVWSACQGELTPNAKEQCDGFDDNCDGSVDEGCVQCAPNTLEYTIGGELKDVMISRDGSFVAVIQGNTVQIVDPNTGEIKAVMSGHLSQINGIGLSADGKRLVTGSADRTVKLWDTSTGNEVKSFVGHLGSVEAVALSADGKKIVSGSADKSVRVWDVSTGTILQTFSGHTATVFAVAFSSTGEQVLSGSEDKTIRLWKASDGALLQTFTGHTDTVLDVAFRFDDKQIVSGSADTTAVIWDPATGKSLHTLLGHIGGVNDVAWSPKGDFVATASDGQSVRVWDAATGKQSQVLLDATFVHGVDWSEDGKWLLTASHSVHVWSTTGWALQTTLLPAYPLNLSTGRSLAMNANGTLVAVGAPQNAIKLWDVDKRVVKQTLQGHTGGVTALVLSVDGKYLISGAEDHQIHIWDLGQGKVIQTLTGHTDVINSLSLSLDGKLLASGSTDKTVRVWEVSTGKELRSFTLGDAIYSVSLSEDGKRLAAGGGELKVSVWEVSTGTLLHTFTGHTSIISSVSLGITGASLVSGSFDKSVRLWDVDKKKLVFDLQRAPDSLS